MCTHFFCFGSLAGRMKDPAVRPIAKQWHESGAAEVFPALGFRSHLLNFCFGDLAGQMKDPAVRPIAKQWHEGG